MSRSIEIQAGMTIGTQLVRRRTEGRVSGWWDCECQNCKKVTAKWHSNLGKIKPGNTGCKCLAASASLVENRTTIKKGDRFGSLVATGRVRRTPYGSGEQKHTEIELDCDCGEKGLWRLQSNVKRSLTTSCGCKVATTAEGWDEPRLKLWRSARERAHHRGTPFTIEVKDIVIPAVCPVLGIALVKGEGGIADSSPTLDEIRPGEGYTPGNIWVISWRANKIKGDASYAELQALAAAVAAKVEKGQKP